MPQLIATLFTLALLAAVALSPLSLQGPHLPADPPDAFALSDLD